MDRLYEIQRVFTESFLEKKFGHGSKELTEEEKLGLVKDYVLHLHQELSSLLANTSYKMHRKPMDDLIHPNIFEEIIDTIKFSMGLWHILGRNWQDLERGFLQKSEVVEWKMKQDSIIDGLAEEEVAVLDIDGVLAEYPGPMLEYMGQLTGTTYKTKTEAKIGYGPLEYERLKTLYRTSGVKAKLPPVEGAKEFTKALKDMGYSVVLVSSRPYERFLNILPDTLEWARSCGLTFDALYFDSEKGLKVARRFPKARVFVDDNISFVKDVLSTCTEKDSSNIEIYLLNREEKAVYPKGYKVASSLNEILEDLRGTE